MKYVQLEITNSLNNDIHYEGSLFETEKEANSWIKKKEAEQYNWNNRTSGAVSYRYYTFNKYDIKNILCNPISIMPSITISDIIKIIKHFGDES